MQDSEYKEQTWHRRFSLAQEPEDGGEWPPDWHKSMAQSRRDPKNSNQADPRTTRPSAVTPSPPLNNNRQTSNPMAQWPLLTYSIFLSPRFPLRFVLCTIAFV